MLRNERGDSCRRANLPGQSLGNRRCTAGYAGPIAGEFVQLSVKDVGGIILRGGTVLGSVL